MDINVIRSLFTLCFFVGFIILCFWAYSPKRQSTFDEAAMLPFDRTDTGKKSQERESGEHLND
jgi:cytochrome c oxidase cbb3-type subunit 4